MTICQVMALRAARNAGLYVPNETIDRCVDYVKRSQNADGGFMYMLTGGPSRFPRSAAGVVALYSAGIYEGEEVRRGIDYLEQHRPAAEEFSRDTHAMYGHYYAVQAMWQAGGEHWQKWYPAVHDMLAEAAAGRRLVERFDLPGVRHGDGRDHPADAEQLSADLSAVSGGCSCAAALSPLCW